MSALRVSRVFCAAALSLPALLVPGRAAAMFPSRASASMLVLSNRTDCPIYVYIDGFFVTRCEPFHRQTVRILLAGDVVVVGRFRCDTWGPKVLKLRSGKTTRWAFTEADRRGTGVASEEEADPL